MTTRTHRGSLKVYPYRRPATVGFTGEDWRALDYFAWLHYTLSHCTDPKGPTVTNAIRFLISLHRQPNPNEPVKDPVVVPVTDTHACRECPKVDGNPRTLPVPWCHLHRGAVDPLPISSVAEKK